MAPDLVICKSGPFGGHFILEQGGIVGARCRRFLIATTGQMGLEPRDGSLRILKVFRSWMVLDHFTRM